MKSKKIKSIGRKVLFALPPRWSIRIAKIGDKFGWWGGIWELYCQLGCPRRVMSGPFEGMLWEPAAAGGAWFPKIIGSYEKELHPAILGLPRAGFDVLANVGSSDGYFAIGLARLLGLGNCCVYDPDLFALNLLKKNAKKNRLKTRFKSSPSCSAALMSRDLGVYHTPLIFCDCDGAEVEILNPEICAPLLRSTILVEVHDLPPPGKIGALLRKRFQSSHRITSIQSLVRVRGDLPPAAAALGGDWAYALDEERATAMEWLLLQPR